MVLNTSDTVIQCNGAPRAWTSPHPELKPWHVHACSLVELLGLLVKSRALLDCDKALETQCLPCLGDGGNPSALLAKRRLLLAHDLAVLVLGQGGSCHTTHGFLLRSTEDQYLCQSALGDLAHGLLLHGLHGVHGLHRLHCLGHCKRRKAGIRRGA